jgi:hypothetical protein
MARTIRRRPLPVEQRKTTTPWGHFHDEVKQTRQYSRRRVNQDLSGIRNAADAKAFVHDHLMEY